MKNIDRHREKLTKNQKIGENNLETKQAKNFEKLEKLSEDISKISFILKVPNLVSIHPK